VLRRKEHAPAKASAVLIGLINQSLGRDESWKAYYVEQMNSMEDVEEKPTNVLDIFELEREAEDMFRTGKVDDAVGALQKVINSNFRDNPAALLSGSETRKAGIASVAEG